MRITEVFKPLNELKMSSSKLSKTLQSYGDRALVGFEFEIIVDGENFMDEEQFSGQSEDLSRIDDYEELMKYFDIDLRTKKAIRNAFSEWESDGGEGDEDDWIDDEFNNDFEDFVSQFGLEPTHGWVQDAAYGEFYTEEPTASANASAVYELIADDIIEYDDMEEYLDKVVPDSSIVVPGASYIGAEIVTKPIPLAKVPKILANYLNWIKHHGNTNGSTGLHINISIDGMDEGGMDWVKVGLFMGEAYVLQVFNRMNNIFAQEQLEVLKSFISTEGLNSKKFDEVVKILNSQISHEKYSTFNISHGNYVEFRASGGDDYHLRYEEILNTTLRYVKVLGLGLDKNAARQEYMTKVVKLINDAGLKVDPTQDPLSMLSTVSKKLGVAQEYSITELPEMVYEIYKRGMKPSTELRRAMRLDARKNKLTRNKFKNFVMDHDIAPDDEKATQGFLDYAYELLALK